MTVEPAVIQRADGSGRTGLEAVPGGLALLLVFRLT